MDLSSCRTQGMSPGRIPWTAVNDYAVRHEIEGEVFDSLVHHVREMDREYLDWAEKESEKNSGNK